MVRAGDEDQKSNAAGRRGRRVTRRTGARVVVDEAEAAMLGSVDLTEALIARIAVLEEEVRGLKAALAGTGAGSDPQRKARQVERRSRTVTADGTRGMTRGTSG